MPRKPEQILARMTAIRKRLAALDDERDKLLNERAELYEEGRALDPPVLQKPMAVASGVTEAALALAARKR